METVSTDETIAQQTEAEETPSQQDESISAPADESSSEPLKEENT